MKHTISIEIDDEGNIKTTVNGVPGPKCAEVSKWLDDLGKVIRDSKTPDYYRTEKAVIKVQSG